MKLRRIIITGKSEPVILDTLNTFFIMHIDILVNQNITIEETKRGFVVHCDVTIANKKLNKLRSFIKKHINCFACSFVTTER